MRKLAEQEILKEAEKLSIRSRQPIDTALDLSKTSKNISFKAPTQKEDLESPEEIKHIE